MKKIVLLIIVLLNTNFVLRAQHARSKSKEKNKEIGFKNDKDFNVTTFPDKWKDESAIVLCQKYDFSYVRYGMNNVSFNEVFRKRVYINDKKAKDDYSIYYFIHEDAESNKLGFVVEKPNGKRIEVDLSKAVDVAANEVPDLYRSYYYYKKDYKKIAIPNLEVGDIIDYYVFDKKSFDGSMEIDFPIFSFSLSKRYPILKQKFLFNIDRGFKVVYRAFNNAPPIIEGKQGVNKYGKQKKGVKTYTIEDENRDKVKREIWKYNSLEEPWVKFQVYYMPGAMAKKSTEFVEREKDLINKPLSIEKIKEKILKNKSSIEFYETPTIIYIKKYHKNLRRPKEIADLAYYYLRYNYFSTVTRRDNEGYMNGDVGSINYMRFTNSFENILKRLNVPFKYVIAVDRDNGSFEDVVFRGDITTGIKVGDNYYFYFSNFSSKDMIPGFLLGADAIEFSTANKSDIRINRTNLPKGNSAQNSISTQMNVTFNETMDTLFVVNRDSLTGLMKPIYQRLVLKETSYMNDDRIIYDPSYAKLVKENEKRRKSKKIRLSKSTILRKQEEAREKKEKEDKLREWRADFIKDFFESDYKVTKVDSINIISKGRLPDNTSLVVQEKYQIEELINRAGKNYILNIGKLIGYQLELDEEDMTRESNINKDYPNEYNFNIVINIPDGYYVENVDALNMNVSNDKGEFISSAKIEGNKILFNTTKKYKVIYSSKDEWNKYIEFLEAAYDISQKKIIIKKKR